MAGQSQGRRAADELRDMEGQGHSRKGPEGCLRTVVSALSDRKEPLLGFEQRNHRIWLMSSKESSGYCVLKKEQMKGERLIR